MNDTIYVSNVSTTETEVILIPNRTIRNLSNCGCYGLVLCCGAAASANLPVFIQVGEINIPVLCKAGNTMYANQLQTRRRYPLMFGNGNDNYPEGQFVITSRVLPRSVEINQASSI